MNGNDTATAVPLPCWGSLVPTQGTKEQDKEYTAAIVDLQLTCSHTGQLVKQWHVVFSDPHVLSFGPNLGFSRLTT